MANGDNIFPGSRREVEGIPTHGLPPNTKIRSLNEGPLSGDRVEAPTPPIEIIGGTTPTRKRIVDVEHIRRVDPVYKEWEDDIIKESTPIPPKEVERNNPVDHVPPDIPVPPIIKDHAHKKWVWNECNQRWWTPVDDDGSPSFQPAAGGFTGINQGSIDAIVMWTTWDNVKKEWIRRQITDWCLNDDVPGVPPLDDCQKYGINCPPGDRDWETQKVPGPVKT